MSLKQIRISDLTIEEFRGEIIAILRDFDSLKKPIIVKQKNEPDIINREEASMLVNLKRGTIYNKVNKGEMPCLCSGNPLTFSREDLITWLEHGKPTVAEMIANKLLKNRKKK